MEEDRQAKMSIRKQMTTKIIKLNNKHGVSPIDRSNDTTGPIMSPLIPIQFMSQEEMNENNEFPSRNSFVEPNNKVILQNPLQLKKGYS